MPGLMDVSYASAVLGAAPGPYQELARRLEMYKQKLADQDGTLRYSVKQHLNMAIGRLEVALLQLYKLAVFIRGDYDGREDDDVQKMAIFEQCSRAFSDCQAASQAGLEQLGSIHVQVTSFQTDELQQLQREIERALEQTKIEINANQQQKEERQREVEGLARRAAEAADALQRAQHEKADMSYQLIGGAFSFFGNLQFNNMEVIQRKVAQEEDRLRNAQDQVRRAQESLIRTMGQEHEINVRYISLEQLAQQLAALKVTTDGLNKEATLLLSGFTDLKDKATQLLLLINEMKNRATVTMRQEYKKSMFAEGILQLCRTALVDGRVCDEVETITLEISSGYSGQSIPESVSKLLNEVGQTARETAQKSIAG
ncbi:hypothetical protein N0V84_011632 [Fusarium piperis]|uniref:Uncharacterized protein n=1 Tax=Fusarium piperis TaxID=1435070 RepID=A0A9W8W482_9HYPO|nr:hypothetical protein N0V84_011632 [Fusarium piperis]